jgi:hypothetical protein
MLPESLKKGVEAVNWQARLLTIIAGRLSSRLFSVPVESLAAELYQTFSPPAGTVVQFDWSKNGPAAMKMYQERRPDQGLSITTGSPQDPNAILIGIPDMDRRNTIRAQSQGVRNTISVSEVGEITPVIFPDT